MGIPNAGAPATGAPTETGTKPAETTNTTTGTGNGTAPPAATADDGLGEAGKKAIAAEREARRKAEERLKELEPLAEAERKRSEADKSDAQKATEALAVERDARTKAEAALLRHEVAAAKGVPANLAKFLTGVSKEDIEAAADELLKEIGGPATKAEMPGRPTERLVSGKPSSTLDDESPEALIAKARGQSWPPPK